MPDQVYREPEISHEIGRKGVKPLSRHRHQRRVAIDVVRDVGRDPTLGVRVDLHLGLVGERGNVGQGGIDKYFVKHLLNKMNENIIQKVVGVFPQIVVYFTDLPETFTTY